MQGNHHRIVGGFIWVLALGLTGCTVGPNYQQPHLSLPSAWDQVPGGPLSTENPTKTLRTWWTVLNDHILEGYIAQVTQSNLDLREALWRIKEAQAQRDIATGRYFPEVDFNGSYTRSRQSGNTGHAIPGTLTEHGLYSNGLSASWEPDVFGRVKRLVQSSQADLDATIEGYHDILISLIAQMASTYVELRTDQQRLIVARNNIRSQQQILQLAKDRFNAGLAPELDVTRAQQNLAETQAQLPTLRLAESQALNQLAFLLGHYPQQMGTKLKTTGPIPAPTGEQLPSSLPVDLLRQRPDIRQAERHLAAETARIGVATADRYPSFSLSGRFTLDAEKISQAGSLSSKAYSYGPGLSWYIFSGNAIRNNIKAQRARTQQAKVAYEKTVLNAVREVEDSLAAYSQESLRQQALQKSATASASSVQLARSLYKSGLTDFQTVLDAERTLLSQQDKLVISQGQRVLDLIHLYRAFGGGWNPKEARGSDSTLKPEAKHEDK